MKKMIALALVALMLIPAAVCAGEGEAPSSASQVAFQAGEAVLPNIETDAHIMTGEAWMAVCEKTHMLYGKLCPGEKVRIDPAQNVCGAYVRGAIENGVLREKGEMRYMVIGESVSGLTKIQVSVEISAEYCRAANEVIERRMGGGAAMTAGSVIACTVGRTESTVFHYFFRKNADCAAIGSVTFNGKNVAVLYMGDWNGDGLMELGFMAGMGKPRQETPAPSSTPEPVPQPTQAPKNNNHGKSQVVKATKDSSCAKTVSTTNTTIVQVQVNNQVNIGGTITNNQTVNTGSGCKTPVQKKNCFE